MEQRLTEIEIKLAHVEQALNELSDVMVQHGTLIDRLSRQNEKLVQQLEMGNTEEAGQSIDGDKPPHY